MPQLWLLKGAYEAPGWKDLERDSKAGEVDVVMFDRLAWAMLEADEAPKGYEGLEPTRPVTGLYISPEGNPLYVVDGDQVSSARVVLEALGPEALAMLEKVKDPDTALERLGKAY
jgi:hypothetical protein